MITAAVIVALILLLLFSPIRLTASTRLNFDGPSLEYRMYLYNIIRIAHGELALENGGVLMLYNGKKQGKQIDLQPQKPSANLGFLLKSIKIKNVVAQFRLSPMGKNNIVHAQILSAMVPVLNIIASQALRFSSDVKTVYTAFNECIIADIAVSITIFSIIAQLFKQILTKKPK